MTDNPAPSPLDLLRNHLFRLATRASSAIACRKSWGDKFGLKELTKAWTSSDNAQRVTVKELQAIPRTDLHSLGFGNWDEGLMLIPLWAWNVVADGEILASIGGTLKVKGTDEIDLDIRFGCIAWGFSHD